MKARIFLVLAIVSPLLAVAASAQRTLQPDEIRGIFQQLTSQPRNTWLTAGTLEAIHQEYGAPKTTDPAEINREIDRQVEEYQANPNKPELAEEGQKMKLAAIPFNVRYKLANEFTMTSHVIVKYDGERFYWEITVDSRRDSVVPEAALAGNFETEQFDLNFNQKRIFAWDGEKYTTYTVSGANAIVDAAGRLPRGVNGPLTAGLIPWGRGLFSLANLTAATTVATEVAADGKTQVQMKLTWAGGSSTNLTLDSSKDYAVTAATLPVYSDVLVSYLCSDYKQVGGRWVPSRIVIERRDATSNNILHSDQWTLTAVSDTTPDPESFEIEFTPGTHIDYLSPVTKASQQYDWPAAGGTRLVADRLAYAATEGKEAQNCATVALKYAASLLGKPVSDSRLAHLVGSDRLTSLRAMKAFAKDMGLYCRAVQTDLATLRDLDGVQAILHIPGKQHYVVLDEVENQSVRLIDLSSSRFYYPQSVDSFPAQWPNGVALLLSNRPIRGRFSDLPDTALTAIVGGYWTCTKLYQQAYEVPCNQSCTSLYQVYFKRYTCESAPEGNCQGTVFVRYQESPCLMDYGQGICGITYEWTYYYMRGCIQ